MTTLTKEYAFSLGLPKWPQMVLTGKPVSIEQAKDIIRRTDTFITDISEYSGGNNRQFNEYWRTQFGYTDIINSKPQDDQVSEWMHRSNIMNDVLSRLDFVSTEYIQNSWASCSFIYGPHGWCHPNGTISYHDNIGKWPSVEAVYRELEQLVTAFPYLEMTATLMSGEQCEDDTYPIITFVCRDGKVVMTDEHDQHHYQVSMENRSVEQAVSNMLINGREQGLPNDWMEEFANIIRPTVLESMAKT